MILLVFNSVGGHWYLHPQHTSHTFVKVYHFLSQSEEPSSIVSNRKSTESALGLSEIILSPSNLRGKEQSG